MDLSLNKCNNCYVPHFAISCVLILQKKFLCAEADDFFMKYNSDDEKDERDFKKKRNYLKSIVKWKSKNNLRNQAKQQFKTKLGGNSKKVRRRNGNIHWKVKKLQNRK